MPDRVNPGRMEKYLQIQSKTETKSTKGQVIATWTDSFRIFASQSDAVVAESFSSMLTIAPVTTTFSTYARADLNRKQRIKQDDDIWSIVRIYTDGMFIKIECQRLDE